MPAIYAATWQPPKRRYLTLSFGPFSDDLPAPERPVPGQSVLPAIVLCVLGVWKCGTRGADAGQNALNCKKRAFALGFPFPLPVSQFRPKRETLPAAGSS